MAATLVEIKSRTLAPRPEGEGEGVLPVDESTEDPRGELIRQLLAYQRYRAAAEQLERIRGDFAARHAARAAAGESETPPADEEVELELEDAHVADLLDAYERIVAAIDFTRIGEHAVEYDDTPISLFQDDLIDRLGRLPERRQRFVDLIRGRTRGETIGLFLA
ncbi:MAG: segregation/condensation protein A, partial [bacterium]